MNNRLINIMIVNYFYAEGDHMGIANEVIIGLQERINSIFYKCEYKKECGNISPQCANGGNSYCGLYRKKIKQKH